MNKSINFILHLFLLTLSFFTSRWFFMKYLYTYSLTFFNRMGAGTDFFVPLIQILLITFFLYVFVQSFFSKKIPMQIIYVFYILYFLILIFVLFFKNIGIQGFDINPLSLISDFFSFIVFLNILMFIPIGCLFPINNKRLLIFLTVITLIEISQFVFSLGFFDIGDILTNTLGYVVGSTIIASKLGLKFQSFIYNPLQNLSTTSRWQINTPSIPESI